MFSFLDPYLTYIKLGLAAAAVAVAVILGAYVHYEHVVSALAKSQADLAVSQRDLSSAVALANGNAAQALKADADRKRTVAELEDTNVELTASQALARQSERDIDAAPVTADGTVAGVLESLRASRFGGAHK